MNPGSDNRIGPYRLIRLIESSGMGSVWEAVHEDRNQHVAIKLSSQAFGATQRRRFDSEVKFLASLNHPNIAKLFDAGVDGDADTGTAYFVMELIEGAVPITEYVSQQRLSIRERIKLFIDVCDAVEHGHRQGILHRDLKPTNILVDVHGHVKVIDFGVAKAIGRQIDSTTLQTETGQIVGTIPYMSPEQIRSESQGLDERSDVYSLVVVLYQLLTGELPYEMKSATPIAAMQTVCNELPLRPSEYVPGLPSEIEGVLLKGLAKRKKDRYQSAAALKDVLSRYLKGKKISETSTTLYVARHSTNQFMFRHPIVACIVALLAAFGFAELVGIPLLYKWLPIHKYYLSVLGGLDWIQPRVTGLRHVQIIQITDDTAVQLAPFADELGFENFDTSNPSSLRALHRPLINRLVNAGARVIAFDLYFDEKSLFDEDFAQGLRDSAEAGVPTVIAALHWCINDDDRLPAIEPIVSSTQWGCVSSIYDELGPWEVELLLDRKRGPSSASFTLTAAASYWHPNWDFEVSFDPVDDAVVHIDWYQQQRESDSGLLRYGESRQIVLTANVTAPDDVIDYCISSGDFSGFYSFSLPDDEVLANASMSYEDAFRALDSDLRRFVEGKVVLIGTYRSGEDIYPTADGRLLHGSSGNAAAIESLLQGTAILGERTWYARLAIIIAALIGFVIGVRYSARSMMRIALLIALAVVLVIASLASYNRLLYIFDPIIPLIASIIACELGARVIKTHREYSL